jgi:hypothetical protein
MTTLQELTIADEPARWSALGFALEGDRMRLGRVLVRLAGAGAGAGEGGESGEGGQTLSLSLVGELPSDLDGLAVSIAGEDDGEGLEGEHPNGVIAIDHVVAFSPELDRTIAALRLAGLDLRRVREEPTPTGAPRQAFFRLGEVILEVVQMPAAAIERAGGAQAPARLWGLALIAGDLEATVRGLGERCGEIRAAVQPGREIATVRRSAGLAVPVALMSPQPARAGVAAETLR